MNNLTKAQIIVVFAVAFLTGAVATTYARAYPVAPAVTKGRPVVTGPKMPVQPLGKNVPATSPVHPEHPGHPITSPTN